jgi:hypothetical protein
MPAGWTSRSRGGAVRIGSVRQLAPGESEGHPSPFACPDPSGSLRDFLLARMRVPIGRSDKSGGIPSLGVGTNREWIVGPLYSAALLRDPNIDKPLI